MSKLLLACQAVSYLNPSLDLALMQKRMDTRESLARNLRYLMDLHGWSEAEMSKQTRKAVSQKTINNILQEKHKTNIETADDLAKPFGLSGWQLLLPNLPEDLIPSPAVSALIEAFASASPDGREYISRVAEREASYLPPNE